MSTPKEELWPEGPEAEFITKNGDRLAYHISCYPCTFWVIGRVVTEAEAAEWLVTQNSEFLGGPGETPELADYCRKNGIPHMFDDPDYWDRRKRKPAIVPPIELPAAANNATEAHR